MRTINLDEIKNKLLFDNDKNLKMYICDEILFVSKAALFPGYNEVIVNGRYINIWFYANKYIYIHIHTYFSESKQMEYQTFEHYSILKIPSR